MALENAYTLKAYISEMKNLQISESDFWIYGELSDAKSKLLVPDHLMIENYTKLLEQYKNSYTFTNEEYFKYRFNPARLSKTLYDTTQYAWLILFANEMYSASEFNKQTIYYYTNSAINILKEILAINSTLKNANENEIYQLKLEMS